jgi:apolipoprotein N-acyltransferase
MTIVARLYALPWHLIALCTLASGTAFLSLIYPAWWPLIIVSLACFFYGIVRAPSLRWALAHAFVFGAVAGGAGICWFWDTLPLDWLGLTNPTNQWYLVFASWGGVTLTFALTTMVWGGVFYLLRRVSFSLLLFPILWVLHEESRMWAFSFLTYGERSLHGPHFSPIAFGYPLAEHPYLLQIAEGGGIMLLNLFVAFCGALLCALLIARKERIPCATRDVLILSGAVLIFLSLPLFQKEPETPRSEVRAVLATFDLPLGVPPVDPAGTYIGLLRTIASSTPAIDLAVFPEENQVDRIFPTPELRKEGFKAIFGDQDILIISSTHTPTETRGHDVGLVYETGQGDVLGSYMKMFLMPGGEYMPASMQFVFSPRPDSGLAKYYDYLPDKAPVRTGVVAVPFRDHIVGALVCSDLLSPQLYRTLAQKQGANILVNLASNSWFHHSRSLFTKSIQMAKVHAVQNRAYVLQAANGSPSFAINPQGVVIAESPWGWTGLLPVNP